MIKFSVVGIATTGAYLSFLFVLVEFFKTNVVVAGVVSYVVAVIFNYYSHYGWTFVSKASHVAVASKYLVMIMAGFCFNTLGMYLWADRSGYQYLVVQTALLFVITCWNFLLSKFWVFR